MTTALSIQNLRKTYKNGFEALKGIDLDVQQGDFFALLGPNGAGKSTTIGIVSSLINKTAGQVVIFDKAIDTDISAAKSYLGVVPQEFNFNGFEPVIDIVVNQAGYYGINRRQARREAERSLKELGLWHKRNEKSRELSGGLKRRLMIARALIHRPRLLILDEPTAGVDIEIRRSMWQFMQQINREGTTIILTTHYLEEAESLCRNIAIIDDGVLIENTSMRGLLDKLHLEVFILYLRTPFSQPLKLDGLDTKQLDETTIEVAVYKDQSLNAVFRKLADKGIEVVSMKNKSSRLEELFMRIVNNGNQQALPHEYPAKVHSA